MCTCSSATVGASGVIRAFFALPAASPDARRLFGGMAVGTADWKVVGVFAVQPVGRTLHRSKRGAPIHIS